MVAYWYQPVAKAITNGAASSIHTGIDAPATTGKAVAATAATNPTRAAVTIRVATAVTVTSATRSSNRFDAANRSAIDVPARAWPSATVGRSQRDVAVGRTSNGLPYILR